MQRCLISSLLSFFLCLSSGASEMDTAVDLHASDPLPVSKPFSILFLGDSNTQGEYTISWIVKMLRERAGYAGTGYRPFVPKAALGWGSPSQHPGFGISASTGGWQEYDMAPGREINPPYISPDGLAMIAEKAGASIQMHFTGDSIDFYYLEQNSGSCCFSVQVDEDASFKIDTGSGHQKVARYTLDGLSTQTHQILVTALDPGVTLLGFDVKNSSETPRVICHKWGNGSAHSGHFVKIDEDLFTESVRLLDPDLVIIILGTNDHNIGGLSKERFAENLIEIVQRIKSVDASIETLLVSTFRSNTKQGQPGGLLDQYRAFSYEEAAAESDSSYWDMSTYFEDKYGKWPGSMRQQDSGCYQGEPTYSYPPYIMNDRYHVGLEGAGYIAEELWRRIVMLYGTQFLNI